MKMHHLSALLMLDSVIRENENITPKNVSENMK